MRRGAATRHPLAFGMRSREDHDSDVYAVTVRTDFIAQRGDAFSPQTTLTVEPRDVSKITGSPPNEGIQVAWQIAAGTGSQSYSSTLSGSAGWIALLVTFEPA